MDAKEIAQRIANNANHLSEDNEFIVLAKAYLDQETKIQGLVEALEKIKVAVCGDARPSWDVSPETTETRGRIANVCDVALTAYKEGK